MKVPCGLPLPDTKVYFIGKSDEYHIRGEKYSVVQTGYHWIKEYGFVIWITSETDKETKDTDYAVSCDVDYFKRNFKEY